MHDDSNMAGKQNAYAATQIPEEMEPYRVYPKHLDSPDLGLDAEAKVMAVLILDRYRLSLKNRDRFEENGQVFVIYPKTALMHDVPVKRRRLERCMESLEEMGLITRVSQGRTRPDKLFVHLECLKEEKVTETMPEIAISKNDLYKNKIINNTTSSGERKELLRQWGMETPETADECMVQAALWSLLTAGSPVKVTDRTYSAEMQRLAAEWAQEEDVTEVLCVLHKRSADKTMPYVRAVLLAYMVETYGETIRYYLNEQAK